MNKTNFSAVMIVGIAVAIFFFQPQGEGPDVEVSLTADESSLSTNQVPSSDIISPEVITESTTSDEAIEPSTDPVVELQAALDLAVADREKAEETMRVIEMKLSALESQLDDIEVRGGDPADAQDETLDTFQAIFAEYQDTIQAYDKATAKEAWIEAKIEEAGL